MQLERVSTRGRLVAGLVVLLWLGVVSTAGAEDPGSRLRIVTSSGSYEFHVELAQTPKQKAVGLMYRRSLADRAGMLFDYGRETSVAMWMKNTFIPLDMIFIRGNGRISRIVQRTIPQSLATISSGGPVRAVLEVNGGTAERLGIRIGDRVEYETFGKPQ